MKSDKTSWFGSKAHCIKIFRSDREDDDANPNDDGLDFCLTVEKRGAPQHDTSSPMNVSIFKSVFVSVVVSVFVFEDPRPPITTTHCPH